MGDAISGVLNKALDDEIIPGNPALNLGKVLPKRIVDQDIDPLTADELYHPLNIAQNRFPRHYPLFLLLARTGVRIGEEIALKWADIDFNSRFIEVKRSIVRRRETTPKSGKSRRVDMSPQLAEVLKGHKHLSKKRALALGLGEFPEFVFTNDIGNPVDKENWRRRVFSKVLEKAEFRKIHIHDLRHTYATLRISKGDNIGDVSGQLGHFSVKLTLDVYYKWIPGKKTSQVYELDNLHSTAPFLHPGAFKKRN
jgi:integrase